MAKTVVGLFRTPEDARSVVEALVNSGCRREDVSLVAKENEDSGAVGESGGERGTKAPEGIATGAGIGALLGGAGGILVGMGVLAIPGIGPIIAAGPIAAGLAGAAGGAVAGGLVGGLIGLGIPEEEAHAYAEGVRRGNTLVLAKTDDAEAEQVRAIMNRYNPIDIHSESDKWRAEGWSGRNEASSETVIPVSQEELAIGKREVDTGGVRVHSHVVEQPAVADVHLHQERVQVERMPVDRPLSDADRAFQERTIEARETAEEAVVGKRARVVEEVRVKKEGEERTEHVEDTVRRTDVQVDRTPGGEPRPNR
ncbi:MAG: YsnF/AvaK domain-containing protein [Bacteroidales bacterium]